MNSMMGSDLFFRDKIPVAVLGATGLIGQQLVQLLAGHPWFEIAALCDSEHLIGQPYGQAVNGLLLSSLPDSIARMQVQPSEPSVPCSLILSGLDPQLASAMEIPFAEAGYQVVSSSLYPMDLHVPQIVVEVNPDHLVLMDSQYFIKGRIVATPDHAVMGLTLGLKPLLDQFGLDVVQIATLQPSCQEVDQKSGSVPTDCHLSSLGGEEARIEQESLQILGQLKSGGIQDAHFKISAQCNAMASIEVCVSVKLRDRANPEQLIQAWRQFAAGQQRLKLPAAPFHALYYFNQQTDCFRQFDENPLQVQWTLDKQRAVRIANLRPCSFLDYKFNLLFPPPIQGIARSVLLIGEFLVSKGKIYW